MLNARNIPVYLKKYGEFLLQFKRVQTDFFRTTLFSFDQFSKEKKDLPLFDGFFRKGKNIVAALVTLDVDSAEGQECLKNAIESYQGPLPFFTSISYSNKLKVHVIVELAEGEIKGDKFYRKGKVRVCVKSAAAKIANILNIDNKYLDYLGVSRCYITESLYWKLQEVRDTISYTELCKIQMKTVNDRLAAKAKKEFDSSQVMIQKLLEKEQSEEIVKGWKAKEKEYQEAKTKNLDFICNNMKNYVENHYTKFYEMWGDTLSGQAIALILILIAAQKNQLAWLSSKIGIRLFGKAGYYSAREELMKCGMLYKFEYYKPHVKATVFKLNEGLLEHYEELATKIVLFTDSLKGIIHKFFLRGGGKGSFNSLEVLLCVFAIRNQISLEKIAEELFSIPDWFSEHTRRFKRLVNTYRWASRRVAV